MSELGTIYISGPMSGIPDYNFPEFHRVAGELVSKGHTVINPADLEQPDKSWESCMRVDIRELTKADTLALLKDWQDSKGAGIEVMIASALGMKIIDAYTLEPIYVVVKTKCFYSNNIPKGEMNNASNSESSFQ